MGPNPSDPSAEHVRAAPVLPACAPRPYRSGKSFTLNQLLGVPCGAWRRRGWRGGWRRGGDGGEGVVAGRRWRRGGRGICRYQPKLNQTQCIRARRRGCCGEAVVARGVAVLRGGGGAADSLVRRSQACCATCDGCCGCRVAVRGRRRAADAGLCCCARGLP